MTSPRLTVAQTPAGQDWAPIQGEACIYGKRRLTLRSEYRRTWSEGKVEARNVSSNINLRESQRRTRPTTAISSAYSPASLVDEDSLCFTFQSSPGTSLRTDLTAN